MRKILFSLLAVTMLSIPACMKEEPDITPAATPEITRTEYDALMREVEEIKEWLSQNPPAPSGINTETWERKIDSLNTENMALKNRISALDARLTELAYGTRAVDSLRFDLNGDVVSTPRIETEYLDDLGYRLTRTYDGKGRVKETRQEWAGEYMMGYPYRNGAIMTGATRVTKAYEYDGKTVTVTTRTSRVNMPAGVPYEETVTSKTYW